MKVTLRPTSLPEVMRYLGPLMLVLVASACGSDDSSNGSDTGAVGTLGGPTSATGSTSGTTGAMTTTTSVPSTSTLDGGAATTLSNSVTTAGVGGDTSASGMNTGMTGFGMTTAGPGGGGGGFGGQSVEDTTTAGGSGGTDVSPGETGVFEGTVAAHNQARADVGVTPPMPELVWSDELAEVAQDWANTLVDETNCGNIFHRPNNMYGENIALQGSVGGFDSFTGPDAVASWVAEIDCYTYGTIGQTEQCDPGCIADLNSTGCGHYTQVVWDATTALGCGYGTCEDGNFTIEVIVCNYDPPGNYIGQTPY